MRISGAVLLVIGAGLALVLAGPYFFWQWLNTRGRPAPAPPEQIAAKSPEAAGAATKTKETARTKRSRVQAAASIVAPERERAPLILNAPPSLPPPFPFAGDIPFGTRRADILLRYGRPELRFTTTHQGRLLENYVYLRRDRGARTFARLEDGHVMAALTSPE